MNVSKEKAGFSYTLEVFADNERDARGRLVALGKCVYRKVLTNIMPKEGVNHMEAVTLLGASQVTTWYLGLFANDHTPQWGDVMATFPGLAGEITAYDNPTRYALAFDNPVGGVVSNQTTPVLVEPTSAITVQGGFITSSAAKGATTGVLLSAVKETTPRTVNPGEVLRVTTGLNITSEE